MMSDTETGEVEIAVGETEQGAEGEFVGLETAQRIRLRPLLPYCRAR
jgi:hypothetical protein